jgi:hypothetical protein
MKREDILAVYEAGPDAVVALVERSLAAHQGQAPLLPALGGGQFGGAAAAPLPPSAHPTRFQAGRPFTHSRATHAQMPGDFGLCQLPTLQQADRFHAAFFHLFTGQARRFPFHGPPSVN